MEGSNSHPLVQRPLRWALRSPRRMSLVGSLLRGVGPLISGAAPPSEPIFIVAPPRSGSTILFDLLDRSPEVASLGSESHALWEWLRKSGPVMTGSHALEAGDVKPWDRRALYWVIGRIAGSRRYLDK